MTCKTCKWWCGGNGKSTVLTNAGYCTSPKLAFGVRVEEKPDEDYSSWPLQTTAVIQEVGKGDREFPKDGAATTYPVTDLLTGPDFGCINHETPPL